MYNHLYCNNTLRYVVTFYYNLLHIVFKMLITKITNSGYYYILESYYKMCSYKHRITKCFTNYTKNKRSRDCQNPGTRGKSKVL